MGFFNQIIAFFADLFQNQIFIQGIGFVGTALVVLGMQCKSYNKVVAVKISNELIAAFQYLLLGGYTGMVMNLAACGTNSIYWVLIRKGKSTLPFQIAFGIMFVVIGFMSWHGWVSLFVIFAKLISSVALGINNTRVIRILNLISTPCWLMYNIFMFSIAGMCSDIFMITSLIIAIIRLDVIAPRREKRAAEAVLAAETENPAEKEAEA